MTEFTIELENEYVVSMRNGASTSLDTSKLVALGVELLSNGINQKVRDSASGAAGEVAETHGCTVKEANANYPDEVRDVAQRMMDSAAKSLMEGLWSHRGEGSGVDPRTAVARSIVRKAIKEKVGHKSPDWAKFTGLSDADQLAKLDETYEANKEVFDPAIDAEIKSRSDAAKAKSKLASGMTVNL